MTELLYFRQFARCSAPIQRRIHDRYRMGVAIGVFQARIDGPDRESEVLLKHQADVAAGNVAFALFYPVDHSRLWLDLLWVDQAWRRQGIAQQLLDEVLAIARRRKQNGVILGRSEHNAPMLALLQRAGWTVDHIVHSHKVTP